MTFVGLRVWECDYLYFVINPFRIYWILKQSISNNSFTIHMGVNTYYSQLLLSNQVYGDVIFSTIAFSRLSLIFFQLKSRNPNSAPFSLKEIKDLEYNDTPKGKASLWTTCMFDALLIQEIDTKYPHSRQLSKYIYSSKQGQNRISNHNIKF